VKTKDINVIQNINTAQVSWIEKKCFKSFILHAILKKLFLII